MAMAKRDSVKKSRELKMNYAFYVHELYTKRVPRSAPLPAAFVRDGLDGPSSALRRLWEVAAAAAAAGCAAWPWRGPSTSALRCRRRRPKGRKKWVRNTA